MHGLRRSARLNAFKRDHQAESQAAAPSRKRKVSQESPLRDEVEPVPKRSRLTQANLRKYQKSLQHSDQGQAEMVRTRKIPTTSRTKTTVTTTDRDFATRLNENGVVFLIAEAKPPDDVEALSEALKVERDLPSKAKTRWKKMCDAKKTMAHSELSLESMIVESMLDTHEPPYNYSRYRNDQWSEVDNEITAGISDPKPDVTESYTWSAYLPGTKANLPELAPSQLGYGMPTFAMESKGPIGSHEQAVKQAAYDGAVMTHAALAIDGHVGKDIKSQYQKTKAITVTLSDTEICVYANHAVFKKGMEKPSYHQYRLERIPYAESEENWNKAHRLLFNAQELALKLADSRLADLKRHARKEKSEEARLKGIAVEVRSDAVKRTKAALQAPSRPPPQKPKASSTLPPPALPPKVKAAWTTLPPRSSSKPTLEQANGARDTRSDPDSTSLRSSPSKASSERATEVRDSLSDSDSDSLQSSPLKPSLERANGVRDFPSESNSTPPSPSLRFLTPL